MKPEKYKEIYSAVYQRVEALGYECAGFEVTAEDGVNIVRVYLEMPGGVDTGDCETVSRGLSEYLDSVEAELPERYFLEISSPGLERPLFVIEDYRRFSGKEAQIILKKGRRSLRGLISVSDGGDIVVKTADGERVIPLEDIRKANLVYTPPRGEKKTFKKIAGKKK